MDKIGKALALYIGFIFLAYCVLYLRACPSRQLGAAVLLELILFGISLAAFRSGFGSLPARIWTKLSEKLPERWADKADLVAQFCRRIARAGQAIKMSGLSVIAVLATIDFTALCCASAGASALATTIYSRVPTTALIGLHPAATLEVLAGALVQHRDLSKAEPLYLIILSVRKNVAGANSDLVAALYTDFGDLKVRQHNLADAERWYRKSVSATGGSGRALTALATTLREKGQFEEAACYYNKALAARAALFGKESRQYHDTLRAYMELKRRMSRKAELTST